MDGTGRTCPSCQAELGPSARYCPRCGQSADATAETARVQQRAVQRGPGQPGPAAPGRGAPDPDSLPQSDWILPAVPQPADRPPDGGAGRTQPAATQPGYPPATLASVYPPPGYPPAARPSGADPAAGPSGPPRQPPRRHNGNRPGSSRALWILLPLLLVIAVAAVLLTRPFSHPARRGAAAAGSGASASAGSPAGAGSGAAASASPAASGSATASPAASERQAAARVAAMLTRSVAERSAISSAADDVASCGPNLAADPKVFDGAVSSRRALLAQLSVLPGRGALPAALLGDLTRAWQASITADQAYARWAADERTRGCTAEDTGDPGYQATIAPDAAATKSKTAFTAAWNPVAGRYGLTRYQPGQL